MSRGARKGGRRLPPGVRCEAPKPRLTLRLPVDIPEAAEPSWPYAVRPADPSELEGEAAAAIAEIANWGQSGLGTGHVPLIWRELARLPRMMAATWHKDRLAMSDGKLDAEAKTCSAFAIAAFNQSP